MLSFLRKVSDSGFCLALVIQEPIAADLGKPGGSTCNRQRIPGKDVEELIIDREFKEGMDAACMEEAIKELAAIEQGYNYIQHSIHHKKEYPYVHR